MILSGRLEYSHYIKFNHQEHTAWVHKIHAFPENRFNCALCQSSFPTISNLIQHVKQTECGIKRNTCDLCKQVFNRPSKLQSHRAQCQLERSAQQALVTMAGTQQQLPEGLPVPAQPVDGVGQDGSAQIVSQQPGSQAVPVAGFMPLVPQYE